MEHTQKTQQPFWKRITVRRKHTSRPMTLGRLWLYLLLVAVLLGVGIFFWSMYLFWGVNQESLFVPVEEETQTVLTIERNRLNEVLSFIELRQTNFADLSEGARVIPEPR